MLNYALGIVFLAVLVASVRRTWRYPHPWRTPFVLSSGEHLRGRRARAELAAREAYAPVREAVQAVRYGRVDEGGTVRCTDSQMSGAEWNALPARERNLSRVTDVFDAQGHRMAWPATIPSTEWLSG